jgi:Family of unknown function (DUF6502)
MASRTRDSAIAACERLLPPLIATLLRLGISAADFNELAKEVFVRTAARQMMRATGRLNRSRVAIVTGLTRSEVAHVLNRVRGAKRRDWHLHRADRVLRGWSSDPDFLTRSGRPRALTVKGRHGSFQDLVKRYSGDIPARAMLDELVASSAVRILDNGNVCALVRPTAVPRFDHRELRAVGTRVRALLHTLCHNAEHSRAKLFVSSTLNRSVDERLMKTLLHRIEAQALSFLQHIDDQLSNPPRGYLSRRGTRGPKLGVTVFVHKELRAEENPPI